MNQVARFSNILAFRRGCFLSIVMSTTVVSLDARSAGFDCLIEPFQVVEITSHAIGLLEKVNVRRGDRVRKGQIMATLESKAEKAATDLAQFKSEAMGSTQTAQGKIDFGQQKYDRLKAMAVDSLITLQERDDAEAELRRAESELVVAKENQQQAKLEYRQQVSLLNLRSIRSPIDGVVVDQMLNAGEMADPTSAKKAILKLAQLNPLRVNVILPGTMFGKVKMGMTADLVTESSQGAATYKATVRNFDKLIDGASGTFAAYLNLPNKQLAIAAGAKCKVNFPAP